MESNVGNRAIDEDQRRRGSRARRFVGSILTLMGDLIPNNRYVLNIIDAHLYEIAFERNLEIIEVPPELDALDRLALQRRMLEVRMRPLIELEGPCPRCKKDVAFPNIAPCQMPGCPIRF